MWGSVLICRKAVRRGVGRGGEGIGGETMLLDDLGRVLLPGEFL